MADVVRWMAQGPAQLAGLEQKGQIALFAGMWLEDHEKYDEAIASYRQIAREGEPGARPLHLVVHGAERKIVIAGRHRRLRRIGCTPGMCGSGGEGQGKSREERQRDGFFHGCCPFASGSCAGGGRIGGRSVEVSFFANSISEIRMAGATAETGTEPDSAPQ